MALIFKHIFYNICHFAYIILNAALLCAIKINKILIWKLHTKRCSANFNLLLAIKSWKFINDHASNDNNNNKSYKMLLLMATFVVVFTLVAPFVDVVWVVVAAVVAVNIVAFAAAN